jgi:hypothetical protein
MPIGSSKIGVLGAGLVPGGTETFNAPGTFSIPPGVKKVSITGVGGVGNPGTSGTAGNAGGVVVVAEAAGEGTLAVQVEQVEQAGPQWLGHQLLLTAYLSHQEVQHQLQLVLQEAKLSYHGTHNDISTRYLLRW